MFPHQFCKEIIVGKFFLKFRNGVKLVWSL